MLLNVPLRDVKYDIAAFECKGSSYRQYQADPRFLVDNNARAGIIENGPLYIAEFKQKERELNRISAYGGMEDLRDIGVIEIDAPFNAGNLRFPVARGAGGTQLPILVPIAQIIVAQARVSISNYRGDVRPKVSAVEAENVEVYFDWEMTHQSHRLLFDSPGFHIGIRANWRVYNGSPLAYTGTSLAIEGEDYQRFIHALKVLYMFDEIFIKPSLTTAYPDLVNTFLDVAEQRYQEINGEALFGHRFEIQNFQDALSMVAERVNAQKGLQQYYGLQ